MEYNVHDKKLPIPSFFQVYNYGGGNGDKDREIVYSELTTDTPALINYFYINNEYPHSFQSKLFDHVNEFENVGDLFNYVRQELINKGEIYSDYVSEPYDFNQKVFLLDSGAANIIKKIAIEVEYDKHEFRNTLIEHLRKYYDFANSLKFDIVVGFDLGGKYTEKDGENDIRLKEFLLTLDVNEINNFLLEETAKYLSKKKDYYPYVLATVHGKTPNDYKKCVEHILSLEQKYDYRFWGFALGGIASYKKLDAQWFNGINFYNLSKNDYAPLVGPARASKIVRKMVGNRPIHALGCGGYYNIATNYFCGATSFDAASPVRRVGDGNTLSTKYIFDTNPNPNAKFSKYFVGGFNTNKQPQPEKPSYLSINKISNSYPMCGCPACKKAKSILNIKNMYAKKANGDNEAFFYSKQLMGLHAVYQHKMLCEILSNYSNIYDYCINNQNELNDGILKIYKQL